MAKKEKKNEREKRKERNPLFSAVACALETNTTTTTKSTTSHFTSSIEFLFHLLTYPLLRPLSAVLSINLYGFISWMSSPVKEGKEKVRKQRFQTKPYTSLCDCECGNWQTLCCATLCCVLCTVMDIHCVYSIYPVSHIARRQEFFKLEDKNTNTLSAVTL